MNVAELRTFVVGNPPPSFGGRYFVFLTLATDDGVKGVGEVYAATVHPTALGPLIQDVFERHVQGLLRSFRNRVHYAAAHPYGTRLH